VSRRQLTRKQHAFLQYLREQIDTREVWPTYREIVDHFGYRSPNSVTQNLQALAKKGFLKRDDGAYQLVDRPSRGEIAVNGILTGGALGELNEGSRAISLVSLFPSLAKAQVVRVDATGVEEGPLQNANFLFLGDGHYRDGDAVAVLSNGRLGLRRAFKEGATLRLEPHDGVGQSEMGSRYETPSMAQVLGRYAGHAGPGALVVDQSQQQVDADESTESVD
jgi:repressor LexA